MAPAPLVSVIVPVYNHARYVVPAIRSVLSQTHRPIELIIIDDGSNDGSPEKIRQFFDTQGSTPGIEVFFSARTNVGAPQTINEGINRARGEFISILNSDDLYSPTRIAECIQFLQDRKNRLVFTYVEPINEDGNAISFDHPWRQWYYSLMMQELDVAPSTSFLLIFGNIAVSTGALFFHRSVPNKIGLFKPYRYAHDLDFLFRYSLQEEPALLRKELYYYRVHSSNTIAQNRPAVQDEIVSILKDYLHSCLAGMCINPFAPSFDNWPVSLSHVSNRLLTRALDELLDSPPLLPEKHCLAAPLHSSGAAEFLGRELTIVTHELSRTGAPMLVLELARELVARGTKINVLSMKGGPLRDELAASDIEVRTLEDSRAARCLDTIGKLLQRVPRIPNVIDIGFPGWSSVVPHLPDRLSKFFVRSGQFFSWLASVITVRRLAGEIRGSLLINSFASFPIAFQLLSGWTGRAHWYIHETYDPQVLLRSARARSRFEELYLSKRIRLLFGSEATRDTWARYGFEGIVRYWSGISANAVHGSNGFSAPRRIILSAGTAGTRKGTRYLLEAFALARTQGRIASDIELMLVGCPLPSRDWQARDFLIRISKKDLRGSVRLVPSVSANILEECYRNAALYVQSSVMECLPLTLLKAMAHGLPIVSTDADGCREAIQSQENGVLVPPGDVERLAAAICELLNDDAKASSLGDRARIKFMEMFSLETTVDPIARLVFDGQNPHAPEYPVL